MCIRNRIHCHLIVTFLARYTLWIIMNITLPYLDQNETDPENEVHPHHVRLIITSAKEVTFSIIGLFVCLCVKHYSVKCYIWILMKFSRKVRNDKRISWLHFGRGRDINQYQTHRHYLPWERSAHSEGF